MDSKTILIGALVVVLAAFVALFGYTAFLGEPFKFAGLDFGRIEPNLQTSGVKEFPAGAILAFDLPEGCPVGWIAFPEADGRAIIGASSGIATALSKDLTARNLRVHGGAETVVLTKDELPHHAHHYDTAISDEVTHKSGEFWHSPSSNEKFTDFSNSRESEPVGDNKAHDNMPPYIALFYCKKT